MTFSYLRLAALLFAVTMASACEGIPYSDNSATSGGSDDSGGGY